METCTSSLNGVELSDENHVSGEEVPGAYDAHVAMFVANAPTGFSAISAAAGGASLLDHQVVSAAWTLHQHAGLSDFSFL